MVSCFYVFCLPLGSFEAKAQSEVQRLLGCQIDLSKNEWYAVVYIDVYTDVFDCDVYNGCSLDCSAVRVHPFLAQMFIKW